MDSKKDTLKHIEQVEKMLDQIVIEIVHRGVKHDESKLSDEEMPYFNEVNDCLKGCTYGSKEYKEQLKKLKPALDHHYANNRHHPEYHKNGINDMNLIDLVEMIADWYASCKRHNDGDIRKSIEINQKRFGYSDDIKNLLLNTIEYLDWN